MTSALMAVLRSTNRSRRKGDASRLAVLHLIAERPKCGPKTISQELGFHPSSVTRQVQALEDAGRVKVTADPSDGRSCRLELTPAGRAEVKRLLEIGLQRFAGFIAKWDAEEVRALTRLLVKLERSKAEMQAHAKPAGKRWRERKQVKSADKDSVVAKGRRRSER